MGTGKADEIIRRLDLQPHSEGGHYRETFRDSPADGSRGQATHIYYLLREGERSAWHRLDALEIWHFYAGAPLRLAISADGRSITHQALGVDFAAGQTAHAVVPANAWQRADSLGSWSLLGCTVVPAFAYSGFELAPLGWQPALASAADSLSPAARSSPTA